MIQVRFDRKSPSRLGLLWSGPDRAADPATETRAAGLLFSILGQQPASPVASAKAADPPARRRVKPRVDGLRATKQTDDPTPSIDPIEP